MKICMISGSFPNMKCGVGDYTAHLSQELAKADCKVSIITSRNLEIVQQNEALTLYPVMTDWGLGGVKRLIETIRQIQPNIIHIQYQRGIYRSRELVPLSPWLLRAFVPSVPIVVTFHDLQPPYLFQRTLGRKGIYALWPLFLSTNALIVSNTGDAQTIEAIMPQAKQKLTRIPVGANLGLSFDDAWNKEQVHTALGLGSRDLLISTFCNIVHTDYPMLFQAMHDLVEEGYHFRLLIIGGIPAQDAKTARHDAAYRRKVSELAERLSVARLVSYTGFLPPAQVSAYLLASDICVQLYWDGVCDRHTTLATVFAHGLPIVTTLGTEKPDGLQAGHNVELVPCGDSRALHAALLRLINDPCSRREMRENAARLFQEKYAWDRVAGKVKETYQCLATRERSQPEGLVGL